jgi:general nucleoside transport system permease protein
MKGHVKTGLAEPIHPPADRVSAPARDSARYSAGASLGARVRALSPGVALGALVASLLFGSLLFTIGGVDPITGFRALAEGSFGSVPVLGETLIRATPIALVALGLIASLRAGLFNIGSPGQIGVGALLATLVSLQTQAMPGPLVWVLAAGAGMVGGALWALGPALLKAYLGTNEILTTLVFNFFAIYLLDYLFSGPLQGDAANLAQSDPITQAAQLPVIIPDTRAHLAILLPLIVTVIAIVYLRSAAGFRLELFGSNRQLARHGGVSERRVIVSTMLVSGAAAGIAGWVQVAGVDHRLYATVADPIGYFGFFAAILGLMLPLLVLLTAVGLGALLQGGGSLQIGVGIAPEVIEALIGLVLFLVAVRSSLTFKRRGKS